MKNKKLLMPLAGVAALGAVSPIVVMATSCGEKADSSIQKIEATATRTSWYVGETINKSDIHVAATLTTGVVQDLDESEWTCDDIGDKGFHFSQMGEKTFTIKYHGHSTTLTFTCEAYGFLTFEHLVTPNLCYTANFATEDTLHVYGATVESEAREIDLDEIKITFDSGSDVVAYDETTHLLKPLKATGTAVIRAHYKELTGTEYDATTTLTVNGTSISNATKDTWTGNAWVAIKEASDTTTYSSGFVKVPDYVRIGDEDVKVVEMRADDSLSGTIVNVYVPEGITTIAGGLFATNDTNKLRNVFYGGTKRQWNRISAGENWAGAGCVGGYCLGEDDWTEGNNFVYFANCQGAKFNYDETTPANSYFMSEEKVGAALGNTLYKVDFDLVNATLSGIEANTFKRIELLNSALLPVGYFRSLAIYLDGELLVQDTDYTIDDLTDPRGATIEFISTGLDKIKSTSRIIVAFRTPRASANAVSVKLSKGA